MDDEKHGGGHHRCEMSRFEIISFSSVVRTTDVLKRYIETCSLSWRPFARLLTPPTSLRLLGALLPVGYDGPRRWSRAGRHTPPERRGSEAKKPLFGKTSNIGNVAPNHRPLPRLRAPGCGPRIPPARCGPGPGCPGACSPGAAPPVSPSSTRTSGAIAAARSGPPPTAARSCSGRRPRCSGGLF